MYAYTCVFVSVHLYKLCTHWYPHKIYINICIHIDTDMHICLYIKILIAKNLTGSKQNKLFLSLTMSSPFLAILLKAAKISLKINI